MSQQQLCKANKPCEGASAWAPQRAGTAAELPVDLECDENGFASACKRLKGV